MNDDLKKLIAPYTVGALGIMASIVTLFFRDSEPVRIEIAFFFAWLALTFFALLVIRESNGKSNKTLSDSAKQILKDREVLRGGIALLRHDKITDKEIIALFTKTNGMDDFESIVLTMDDKREIIQKIINVACADDFFRKQEEEALSIVVDRYGLESDVKIKEMVEKARNLYPQSS